MTGEQFDAMIERMALAVCNSIRHDHGLPPLADMGAVEASGQYRRQAAAAYSAQAEKTNMADDTNVISMKPRVVSTLTTEQRLALMTKYEDALCQIADAAEAKQSFASLRRIAAETLGIK